MSHQSPQPCPFCGSGNISDGEVLTADVSGKTSTQSMCNDCGAFGPAARLEEGEIDYGDVKAITAWNTRTIASVKREPLNIPDGWKLVPIVATEEMCREGDDCQDYDPRMDESESYYTWTAMINAAPSPPVTATTASREGE